MWSETIGRTPHPQPAPPQDVRVNHCGPHVAMPQQLLDSPDVVTGLEKMRGERVAQGVTARPLRDARSAKGDAERSLDDRLVQMMAPALDRKSVV